MSHRKSRRNRQYAHFWDLLIAEVVSEITQLKTGLWRKNDLTAHQQRGVGLNPKLTVRPDLTNIPYQYLLFRDVRPIYWEAEMLGFDEMKSCLRLRVIDYKVDRPSPRFEYQQPKKEIASLFFEKLDWQQLEPLLSSYKKAGLENMVFNLSAPAATAKREPGVFDLAESSMSVSFSVPFSAVQFVVGMVHIEYVVPKLDRELAFSIENPVLLPEFELIKPWFAKKLKSDHVQVNAEIHFKGGEIERISAQSKQIAAINDQMLQAVRQQRLRGITRTPKVESPDKTLFTSEDIFDTCTTICPATHSVRPTARFWIFYWRTKTCATASSWPTWPAPGTPISSRCVLHWRPSSVFYSLLKAPRSTISAGNYSTPMLPTCGVSLKWEFLLPCSTNRWRSRSMQRKCGRQQYRQQYRQSPEQYGYSFHYIEHEHIGSALVDAFPKWRHRLEELLV
ncbi:MAG: hypothetical protein IPL65_00500 [Lewinellaceae bacterium]|nr:hypothetical protein [Lewinellaceae bacterium]